jgi:hypothetical protein
MATSQGRFPSKSFENVRQRAKVTRERARKELDDAIERIKNVRKDPQGTGLSLHEAIGQLNIAHQKWQNLTGKVGHQQTGRRNNEQTAQVK